LGHPLIFTWLKKRRRKRINAQPVPEHWAAIIAEHLPYTKTLAAAEREQLLGLTQLFLHEKHIEGCAGFEITEVVKITIAAQACILILNQNNDLYPKLKTILVYETAFIPEFDEYNEDGTMSPADDVHAGESWEIGVVILAWQEILQGLRHKHDGYNVIIHEFAHQLDHEKTGTDGVPLLEHRSMYPKWQEVFSEHYAELLEDTQRHKKTILDDYGATNPAEFFAVASESFFEESIRLKGRHPDLYEVLVEYYKQDPAQNWENIRT
jgi:hypothetical protein